jgi:hypothetical protein
METSNPGGWDEHVYEILVEKTEGKVKIGRPPRRWENDIKFIWKKKCLGDCNQDSFWITIETSGDPQSVEVVVLVIIILLIK